MYALFSSKLNHFVAVTLRELHMSDSLKSLGKTYKKSNAELVKNID